MVAPLCTSYAPCSRARGNRQGWSVLLEPWRGLCRAQGLCCPWWVWRLASLGNNGRPGTASRTVLLTCVFPLVGRASFKCTASGSRCEKISRHNCPKGLQQLSSSGKKSTAPQSSPQGPPPPGPFCLLALRVAALHSHWFTCFLQTLPGWVLELYSGCSLCPQWDLFFLLLKYFLKILYFWIEVQLIYNGAFVSRIEQYMHIQYICISTQFQVYSNICIYTYIYITYIGYSVSDSFPVEVITTYWI